MSQKSLRSLLILAYFTLPSALVSAQTTDVGDSFQTFLDDMETIMLRAGATLAVLSFLGLAFMYLGSSLPVINKWKQNNPDAFNNTLIGLGILLFVGGGAAAAIVSF